MHVIRDSRNKSQVNIQTAGYWRFRCIWGKTLKDLTRLWQTGMGITGQALLRTTVSDSHSSGWTGNKKNIFIHTLVPLTILIMLFVLELNILFHPGKGRMMASQTHRHSSIAQQGFEHFHHRESTVKHLASARRLTPETVRITIQHPRKSMHWRGRQLKQLEGKHFIVTASQGNGN